MKTFNSLVGALVICLSSKAADPVLFESAKMGQTGDLAGYSVHAECFEGARFSLTNTCLVSAVGSHLNRYRGSGVFAAILRLESATGFPRGNPFDPEEVVAAGAFTLNEPLSSDYVFPMPACLTPGHYAIVFGKNGFGDTALGTVIMTFNNEDLPGVRPYFQWDGFRWEPSVIQNVRLVVYGAPVPEPVLEMVRDGKNAMILRWPVAFSNFVLEASESLSPTQWAALTNVPWALDDRWVISNRIDQSAQYFRLKKQ